MISRRGLLTGAAGAVVIGFVSGGGWVTAAAAEPEPSGGGGFVRVPRLDGTLHLDEETRREYSRDLGRQVVVMPHAVLRPASTRDVAAMVRFCAERRIPVHTRGQGHSTAGQGLGPGLLIDSRSLATIHSVGADVAEVGPGVWWRELLDRTAPVGLTPPLLVTFLGLSIGGTLSMGGVPANNRWGIQADQVRRLEVVTGTGEVVICSLEHRRDLFEAMLAGLGQCGVITRAWVNLIPAATRSRTYILVYQDNATFFRDFRALVDRGEVDGAYTLFPLVPDGSRVVYALNAMKWYSEGAEPDDTELLRGLTPLQVQISDTTYREWGTRYDPLVEQWIAQSDWENLIKPWSDVILPDSAVEEYVGRVVPTLDLEQVGATGTVFLFRTHRDSLTRPYFSIPDPDGSDWVYLFDVLTSSALPGPDEEFTTRMLQRNRQWFEEARAVGGTRYPMGSTPFTPEDWRRQYGRNWRSFERAKRRYDPHNIMTPGVGIFPR